MKISGFQKMTVLDFPGKVACTVFTSGCNLRCPFCHNARLVTHKAEEDEMDENEILTYIYKRKGLLDGVCITGGEPLLQPDIEDFIRKIKDAGFAVKLDTNGFYPEKLERLINEGLLDYVAMDIKNSPTEYAKTCGFREVGLAPVEKSKNLLLQNRVDYEFRTTVVKELHTKESLLSAGEWIKGAKRYFLQAFVDSGDLIGEGLSAPDKAFMKQVQEDLSQFVEKVELRGV
ncbi:MAG: anaerobic ribonucleoside-triphosphate reductase activating protein [Clostridia bacterium]|nr:anaerobic ribonucleoside-triphosphate reductase activating protein [Clostridia bacterium]